MSTNRTFHFPSPVSFYAWYGEAAIGYRLLSEWGWTVKEHKPANSEAIANFIAFAPEPGTTEEQEQAIVSHWNGWHILMTYFSFGSFREIYSDYPVPMVELTVPSGFEFVELGTRPDFYLDLMIDQHFYFAYVRDGILWREQMEVVPIEKNNGHFVLTGDTVSGVEWVLNTGQFFGYGFKDRIVFSADLASNLRTLGLPIQHWQKQSQDIVNEALTISCQDDMILST